MNDFNQNESDAADAQVLLFGAELIAEGIVHYPDWAGAMKREFDDDLNQELKDVYAECEKLASHPETERRNLLGATDREIEVSNESAAAASEQVPAATTENAGSTTPPSGLRLSFGTTGVVVAVLTACFLAYLVIPSDFWLTERQRQERRVSAARAALAAIEDASRDPALLAIAREYQGWQRHRNAVIHAGRAQGTTFGFGPFRRTVNSGLYTGLRLAKIDPEMTLLQVKYQQELLAVARRNLVAADQDGVAKYVPEFFDEENELAGVEVLLASIVAEGVEAE